MLILVPLTLFVFVPSVNAVSDGVKGDACTHMFPGHAAAKQEGASPYKLSTSSLNYGCDSHVSITLSSNELQGFKGFLCQARRYLPDYVTYGTLTSDGTVPMINKCDQAGSLSHSNPIVKSSVTFLWSPPDFDAGDITIICTIVKEFGIFWTDVFSQKMTHTTSCSVQTVPTSTSNVTSSSDVTRSTTNFTINTTKSSKATSNYSNMTSSMSSSSSTVASSSRASSTTADKDYTYSSSSNSDQCCVVCLMIPVLTVIHINGNFA